MTNFKFFKWSVSVALFALSLCGCGGGGGGVVSMGLQYSTIWEDTATAGSPKGQSELLTIVDSNGNEVITKLLNRSIGDGITFDSLASGAYKLRATAYTGSDAGGSVIGNLEIPFSVPGTPSISTVVAGLTSQMAISPDTSTVQTEHTQQFSARALNSSGLSIFRPAGSFNWSTVGGIGTVDIDGLFTASTAGDGAVRVSEPASGSSASSSVHVTPFVPVQSKWTVLVYMNAANDLFTFSDGNVNQMEQVAGNNQVRFVVQWKQARSIFPTSSFNGTRRYLVKPDTTAQIKSELVQDMGTSVDMGVPQTLRDFILWGKKNYPAEHYVLVIWNHGSGWNRSPSSATRAVSFDDETGSAIQTWELRSALTGQAIDILAWDSSLMQMMEVAYELSDVSLVAGSEESPPGEGYPYDLVFKVFRDNSGQDPKTLSKGFVDGMLANPNYASRKITQSVIEVSKLGPVATAIDSLAVELINNRGALTTIIPSIRSLAQSYSPTSRRYYRDIVDIADLLTTTSGVPASVVTAAANVKLAVANSVVWEGHNSNSPKSHGIAIDFSPGSVFSGYNSDYANLQFAQATKWDEWLLQSP